MLYSCPRHRPHPRPPRRRRLALACACACACAVTVTLVLAATLLPVARYADKLVLARPTWYKVAIWLEILVQAPVYVLGLYAFSRRRNWVRGPALVYAIVLLTIMPMVLAEQLVGEHATDRPLVVLAVYSPWLIMPVLLLWRVFPSGGAPVFATPDALPAMARAPTKSGQAVTKSPARARARASPARSRR